jgi:hypothetical protein
VARLSRRLPHHTPATLTLLGILLAAMLALSAAPAEAAPPPKPECADRIDNDGDGAVDYHRRGGDSDCTSRKDNTERPTLDCTDEDGDGIFSDPPSLPNAIARCDLTSGQASIGDCEVGYFDLNEVAMDGCEYGPISYTGPETCDGVDNDVDGEVDEGLVLPDVQNGTLVCSSGAVAVICEPGFADANSDPSDGCESESASIRIRTGS